MTEADIRKDIEATMPARRLEHTKGVEYTACCLAYRYGADPEKARLAGLLHDCAKYIPPAEKIAVCEEEGIPVSECERRNPELLHAKLGAFLARTKYGVTDPEILSAITWHTTGRPEMTLLDKILFIADYIEPNRDHAPNLGEIRILAFEDIGRCLIQILSDTVEYLKTLDHVTDPMTEETYHFYTEENE